MKNKINILLLFTSIMTNFCFGQLNSVQLDDIEGNIYKEDSIIVPKYNIKFDNDMRLYHNNSLIFNPKGKFEHVLHEIRGNRYWVITAFEISHSAVPVEAFAKKNIIIIDTENWEKLYYFDLKGSAIFNIYESKEGLNVIAVKPEDLKQFKPN